MVDTALINLLLIVESISIAIATIVIILELWIHRSTVKILKRMDQFSIEMDTYISKQMNKIDEHTRVLDRHVEELNEHTSQMERILEKVLKENESIYNKICRPGQAD